ncbi:ASNA ATPase, partial [Setophaga kirtlandii]|nr:ASNA ATPase [Setophaga kirtlandii]
AAAAGGWAAEGPEEFEDAPDVEPLEPTLANIIEQRSLKWIFVGGKGGVGKTTCRLEWDSGIRVGSPDRDGRNGMGAPDRDTGTGWDPGPGKRPGRGCGCTGLSAQEIDPSLGVAELPDEFFEEDNVLSMGKKMMQEAMSAFPGIDEAMSYAEVMR